MQNRSTHKKRTNLELRHNVLTLVGESADILFSEMLQDLHNHFRYPFLTLDKIRDAANTPTQLQEDDIEHFFQNDEAHSREDYHLAQDATCALQAVTDTDSSKKVVTLLVEMSNLISKETSLPETVKDSAKTKMKKIQECVETKMMPRRCHPTSLDTSAVFFCTTCLWRHEQLQATLPVNIIMLAAARLTSNTIIDWCITMTNDGQARLFKSQYIPYPPTKSLTSPPKKNKVIIPHHP